MQAYAQKEEVLKGDVGLHSIFSQLSTNNKRMEDALSSIQNKLHELLNKNFPTVLDGSINKSAKESRFSDGVLNDLQTQADYYSRQTDKAFEILNHLSEIV